MPTDPDPRAATPPGGDPADDAGPAGPAGSRRIFLGAGALAALAGAGWAWWRESAQPPAPAAAPGQPAPGPAPGTATGGIEDFWALQFEQPAGGLLELKGFRGRPLLVNFWATWCPPCVREMPALDELHRQLQGRPGAIIGLAIDGPTPVREFLAKLPVGFPIGLAGLDGTEWLRRLGNSQGGLPFSVLFDREGSIVDRHMGELKPEDLKRWSPPLGLTAG